VTRPADTDDTRADVPRIVGRSVAMQEVYKLIGLVSQSDVTVLVEGESGVGKELVARAIHHYGHRRERPFVAINCGALPEALLESELFGYERGAFTGAIATKAGRLELADGGTLFLDEVSELSLAHQAKLLRVLENGQVERLGATRANRVDARVIAASNRPLPEAVAAHGFREDLYFRLQVVTVTIPPLRERHEDIPDLVAYFLALARRETGREIQGLDAAAAAAVLRYSWPGNVRELENAVRRAVVLARTPVIGLPDLPPQVVAADQAPSQSMSKLRAAAEAELRARLEHPERDSTSIYHDVIATIEASLVQAALELTGGNQVRAADLLGVNRTTLRKRMSGEGTESGGV
jgi:DNA-binding NtrC family response regulator